MDIPSGRCPVRHHWGQFLAQPPAVGRLLLQQQPPWRFGWTAESLHLQQPAPELPPPVHPDCYPLSRERSSWRNLWTYSAHLRSSRRWGGRGASHQNYGAAHRHSLSLPGYGKFSRISSAGEERNSLQVRQLVVIAVPHGEEGGRVLTSVGDFRRLNMVTVANSYPLLNMLDFSSKAARQCTIFSKINLRKGYHQIPVQSADIHKTVITAPFSAFKYLQMPFGLMNAGATFQQKIDRQSSTWRQFLPMSTIWTRPARMWRSTASSSGSSSPASGLIINAKKCMFGASSIKFLGHSLSAGEVEPLPAHMAAMLDFPRLTTVKELLGFFGMVNFYRQFLPGAAMMMKPFADCLRCGPKGPTVISWDTSMATAFERAKQFLASAAQLAYPDQAATHVGACLQQQRPG